MLKIDHHAVEQMQRHVQREPAAPEAGGVLLGRWLHNPKHYVVDDVSEPTAEDRRTRVSFFRAQRPHQRRILSSLQRSQQTCGYLGGWHTHPESVPHPSPIDLRDWRRHLVEDHVDIPELFFIIVGIASTEAWMAPRTRSGKWLVQLERVVGL